MPSCDTQRPCMLLKIPQWVRISQSRQRLVWPHCQWLGMSTLNKCQVRFTDCVQRGSCEEPTPSRTSQEMPLQADISAFPG